jgi:adenylate cyclase
VSLVDTLFMAAIRHAFAGDAEAVLDCADEALDLATSHGFPLYDGSTRVLRGWARVAQDGSTAAVTEMETALATVQSTGARMYSHFFFGLLADACMTVDRPDTALAAVEEGLAEVDARGERFWEAELLRLRGVLLATGGGRDQEAEEALVRAWEVARTQQARGLESRATASLDQVRNRQKGGAGTPSASVPP